MKKFIIALGALSLVACGQSGEEAAEAEAAATAEAAGPTAPDGGPLYGTFNMRDSAANEYQGVFNEDGTFAVDNPEGGVDTGTWEATEDGFCLNVEGSEEGPLCVTSSEMYDDGTWTNLSEGGINLIVSRVVEEDAGDEAGDEGGEDAAAEEADAE